MFLSIFKTSDKYEAWTEDQQQNEVHAIAGIPNEMDVSEDYMINDTDN